VGSSELEDKIARRRPPQAFKIAADIGQFVRGEAPSDIVEADAG
jgi:hypothetical protein